jgi:2-polyprenyl-6-methoxyphenol hydroxylase-like FAD-dependent oxidoreductase
MPYSVYFSAGYGQYIVARPKLYELILRQVPAHKVHFGHRVLNISEKEDKVTVHLANNSTFEGDIIVGADGAYSAVRQRMYEQLRVKGALPKSDQEELPFSCTCLVGQTKVLDPEEYPIVKEPLCQFRSVFGDEKPFTVSRLDLCKKCTFLLQFLCYSHMSFVCFIVTCSGPY